MYQHLTCSYTRLELTVAYADGHHYMRFIPLTDEQAKAIERVLRNGERLELDTKPSTPEASHA